MATPFGKLLGSSDIFTFYIGEDKLKFIVHADCFATLSKPMHSLIKGEFKEASDREAYWPHVDATTFGLLSEFCYKGDYDAKGVPQPNKDPNPDVEVLTAQPAPHNKRARSSVSLLQYRDAHGRRLALHPALIGPISSLQARIGITSMTAGQHVEIPRHVHPNHPSTPQMGVHNPAQQYAFNREEKRQDAAEQIAVLNTLRPDLEGTDLKFDSDGVRIIGYNKFFAHFLRGPMIRDAGKGPGQDSHFPLFMNLPQHHPFSPPAHNTDGSMAHCLMLHARLFVIAQEKMMEGLKVLVLAKIHWILVMFPLDRARLAGTIDVARYVFDNTYGDKDELRLMMADHFALNCKRDNVGGSKLFADVMEEGGEFARFIWRSIFWRRLN